MNPRVDGRDRRHRRAAALAAVFLLLVTAAVFLKQLPLGGHYEIRAVVKTAVQLKKGSQVRIAGEPVGTVQKIGPGRKGSAVLTLRIDNRGRPVRDDASLTVKPRLILEGNAYIDLRPGSSSAAELKSGGEIPLSRTAVSVQLDQVLDTLDAPARDAIHGAIGTFSGALGRGPGDRVSGEQALRGAVREFDAALPPVTQVAHSLRGTEAGDLSRLIRRGGDVTSQLARNPAALSAIVTNFNRVSGALAARDQQLAASVRGFDDVVRSAPPTLRALNAALPPLTRFGEELRPAAHAAPSTLRKASRLLDQIDLASRKPELPRLLTRLAPVTSRLPRLERRLGVLFRYTEPVTSCISTHVVPTLDMKIKDGSNTTGDPVYLDLMHLFTGLSGFSSAVDGNGGTVRLGITAGTRNLSQIIPGLGRVVTRATGADGVRPSWLGFGKNPPFRPDQPCAKQKLPNLSARSGPAPSWATGGGQ